MYIFYIHHVVLEIVTTNTSVDLYAYKIRFLTETTHSHALE